MLHIQHWHKFRWERGLQLTAESTAIQSFDTNLASAEQSFRTMSVCIQAISANKKQNINWSKENWFIYLVIFSSHFSFPLFLKSSPILCLCVSPSFVTIYLDYVNTMEASKKANKQTNDKVCYSQQSR